MRTWEGDFHFDPGRRYLPHSPTASSALSQPTPFALQTASFGHDDTTEQYGHIEDWEHGYRSDRAAAFSSSQTTGPLHGQEYVMEPYRTNNPLIARSNNPTYMDSDSDAGCNYGAGATTAGLSARHSAMDSNAYAFPNTLTSFSSSCLSHDELLPLAADRDQDESATAGRPTNRTVSRLPHDTNHPGLVGISTGYGGYESATYALHMQRGSNVYTAAPAPEDLLMHEGSLRPPMQSCSYGYAATGQERSPASGMTASAEFAERPYQCRDRECCLADDHENRPLKLEESEESLSHLAASHHG